MVGLRFQQSTWFRRRDPVPSWILPLPEYLSHAQAESPRESVPRFLRMVTSGMEWCEESDVANGCHVRQLRRKILVHFFCPTTSPPDLLPLIPCISSHQRPFLSYSNPCLPEYDSKIQPQYQYPTLSTPTRHTFAKVPFTIPISRCRNAFILSTPLASVEPSS